MVTKDLTGKKLERLVATLERTLAGTNAAIEAPSRRLLDRDTGKPREHDVLIVWDHGAIIYLSEHSKCRMIRQDRPALFLRM